MDHQVDRITSFGADSLESALGDNRVFTENISSLYQKKEIKMGFDQYHEPPEELSQEMRTFARMITSLIEEAEAIGWYEQRMSLEKDKE
ncbi:MAG TPA: hypothetical protein DDW72_07850, partial [Afipia sp.]|nr:hypothetical protein [Afipia sp.]